MSLPRVYAVPGKLGFAWVEGGQPLGPNTWLCHTKGRVKGDRNRRRGFAWLLWRIGGEPRCMIAVKCKGEPCDPAYLEFDHKNGNADMHVLGNLQPACSACNSWKNRQLKLRLSVWAPDTHRGPTVGGVPVRQGSGGAGLPEMLHRGQGVPFSLGGLGAERPGSENDKHDEYLKRFLKAAPEYFRAIEYGRVGIKPFLRAMVPLCTYTDSSGVKHEPNLRATLWGFVDERLAPDNPTGLFTVEDGLIGWVGPRLPELEMVKPRVGGEGA